MNARLCVGPTIGLLLLFGTAAAGDADADQEAAIAAIQKSRSSAVRSVSSNPPIACQISRRNRLATWADPSASAVTRSQGGDVLSWLRS